MSAVADNNGVKAIRSLPLVYGVLGLDSSCGFQRGDLRLVDGPIEARCVQVACSHLRSNPVDDSECLSDTALTAMMKAVASWA